MKARSVHKLVQVGLCSLIAATFTGCVSYPVSKELRQQAQPLTVEQVAASPRAYTGAVVIWGGRVLQTVNTTNGGDMYVLAMPLTKHEQPVLNGVIRGRFIARGRGFIDPEVFKKGRLVTVAGTITGVAAQPLQGVRYVYPVVSIRELHLWYVQPAYYYPYYYPGGYWGWYGPSWGWGWYGPGWRWGWSWGWGGPGWDGDWD
jgi:outer membrane lipoprotein